MKIKTLVLYAGYTRLISYFDDWRDAFATDPRFESTLVDVCRPGSLAEAARETPRCDLLVLLHSTNGDTLDHILPFEGLLAGRRGRLLSFVGNEVNLPTVPMAEKIAFLRRIGADFIGTQLPIEAGRWLFAETPATVVALPHALNPDAFGLRVPLEQRPYDLVLRSAAYPPYLGDNERSELFDRFASHPFSPPLATDVSCATRLDREGWAALLNSGRMTHATEAGSYYLERDDRTLRAITSYALERSRRAGRAPLGEDSLLRQTWRALPSGMKARLRGLLPRAPFVRGEDVLAGLTFEELRERFFAGLAPCPAYSKCISSRHFDAIGTRTCQVMLRGRYNDILVPWEHYIPIEKDYRNMEEVEAAMRDADLRARITTRAFELVADAHTYRHRLDTVSRLLGA